MRRSRSTPTRSDNPLASRSIRACRVRPHRGRSVLLVSDEVRGEEAERGYYARLGVEPDADLGALRAAYRSQARKYHPDLQRRDGPDTARAMAEVNKAWETLSDPRLRRLYDEERKGQLEQAEAVARTRARAGRAPAPAPFLHPQPSEAVRLVLTRQDAWLSTMALRIRLLVRYAGRSAAQTMLLRHPGTARDTWEAMVPAICEHLVVDVGERIRLARAAAAAPLDLANAAALIGLRMYGEQLLAGTAGLSAEERDRHAEMVDRMYETLAYELPRELVQALGDSPRVHRRLTRRR